MPPARGCTLRVTVNGATARFADLRLRRCPHAAAHTDTHADPGGGGRRRRWRREGGSVSVSVSGPTSGSRSVPLDLHRERERRAVRLHLPVAVRLQPARRPSPPVGQTPTCSYASSGIAQRRGHRPGRDSDRAASVSPGSAVTICWIAPRPSSGSTLSGPTLTINPFNGRYSSASGSPVTFSATETEANASSFTWDFGRRHSRRDPAGSSRTPTPRRASARTPDGRWQRDDHDRHFFFDDQHRHHRSAGALRRATPIDPAGDGDGHRRLRRRRPRNEIVATATETQGIEV